MTRALPGSLIGINRLINISRNIPKPINALATEIASINEEIERLKRGVPMESVGSLKYSRKIRKS